MMQSCYGECLVHRETPMSTQIIKALIVIALVISGLGLIVFFGLGEGTLAVISFIFGFIAVMLVIYLFPRFNIDWEYVFVDGQLDFDQILGGNARRRKDRIDFEKMEAVAPTGSYHLDNFKHVELKTLDYSALKKDNKTYTIICHKEEQMVRILFEPDEAMINLMKQKSPRKVFTD